MRIAIAADHAGVHLEQLIQADRVAEIAALELETEEVTHALVDGP